MAVALEPGLSKYLTGDLEADELATRTFYLDLFAYLKKRGELPTRMPRFGPKDVDLFLLYKLVTGLGGFVAVCEKKLWHRVLVQFYDGALIPGPEALLRSIYVRHLLPYELRRFFGLSEEEAAHRLRDIGPPRELPYSDNGKVNLVHLAACPIRDYSAFITHHSMLGKRPGPGGVHLGPYPKKPRSMKEPEYLQQQRLALALDSGFAEQVDWAIEMLGVVSFTLDMALRPEVPLLDAVVRFLKRLGCLFSSDTGSCSWQRVLREQLQQQQQQQQSSSEPASANSTPERPAPVARARLVAASDSDDSGVSHADSMEADTTNTTATSSSSSSASQIDIAPAAAAVPEAPGTPPPPPSPATSRVATAVAASADEIATDKRLGTFFNVLPSESRMASLRRMAIVLLNLSAVGENKRQIAQHTELLQELSSIACANDCPLDVLCSILGIFGHVCKYMAIASKTEHAISIPLLLKALYSSENPDLVDSGLEIAAKLAERGDNDSLFAAMPNAFFRRIVYLLSDSELQQSQQPNAQLLFKEKERHERRLMHQYAALEVVHNLSLYQSIGSERMSRYSGCLERVSSLLSAHEEKLAVRAALSLLNLASNPANHDVFLPFEARLVMMAQGGTEATLAPRIIEILLKLLTKLSANSGTGDGHDEYHSYYHDGEHPEDDGELEDLDSLGIDITE